VEQWWSLRHWYRWFKRTGIIGEETGESFSTLKDKTPAEIWLIYDSVRHTHILQDHAYWMRERLREAEQGQSRGLSWSSAQMKPSRPITWAEFEAQGIETPWDYEMKFLPGRGWDDRATGIALN
jgi:hypothetical protein